MDIMASEIGNEFSSDCVDRYVTKISRHHVDFLKEKIAKHLLEAKNLSAEIHHFPGKPAKLFITDGNSDSHVSNNRDSKKLLVTNLPELADEEFLEMFFEHTKRQGGGPVKSVHLHEEKRQAIVEFEHTDAVQLVLSKQPIKMLRATVNVEQYEPYLEQDETLKCIEILDIHIDLIEEIANMKINHAIDNYWGYDLAKFDIHSSFYNPFGDIADDDEDIFSRNLDPEIKFRHVGVFCDGCKGHISGIRYKCTRCHDFDFCSTCRKEVQHNPKHKFKEIKHPLML